MVVITNSGCTSGCDVNCEYHCRSFGVDKKLPVDSAAFQYKQIKIIQNTVRVPASLYLNDLAALNVYQQPGPYGVNWNQISDRRVPHFQPRLTVDRGNSTRRTVTGIRPGAQCPGGYGVDVKHGSYDRYLLRLKGKGPARRQQVPDTFGRPIQFSAAHPVYGGKTVKPSIVGWDCVCEPIA